MEISNFLKAPVRYEYRPYLNVILDKDDNVICHEMPYPEEVGNFIAEAINEKLKPKTTRIVEIIYEHGQLIKAMECCKFTTRRELNYCPICGAKIVRGEG